MNQNKRNVFKMMWFNYNQEVSQIDDNDLKNWICKNIEPTDFIGQVSGWDCLCSGFLDMNKSNNNYFCDFENCPVYDQPFRIGYCKDCKEWSIFKGDYKGN